uniref:Uncharacterized protein n=1 Tax=Amphilophus citrinellus TaxID=61819 RepID=A0A3Q0SK32_AMPCI
MGLKTANNRVLLSGVFVGLLNKRDDCSVGFLKIFVSSSTDKIKMLLNFSTLCLLVCVSHRGDICPDLSNHSGLAPLVLAKRHCANKDAIHLLKGQKVKGFKRGAHSRLESMQTAASERLAEVEEQRKVLQSIESGLKKKKKQVLRAVTLTKGISVIWFTGSLHRLQLTHPGARSTEKSEHTHIIDIQHTQTHTPIVGGLWNAAPAIVEGSL